jgi:hypothetical protein
MNGIYTLANDAVYDQLVALLNSIEANYSKDIPVCVIPYDNDIGKIAAEIKSRPNVTLFQDSAAIAKWEQFAQDAWNLTPNTSHLTPRTWGRHKLGVHRKLCSFDGPFEKFVFMDADTLCMNSLDFVFEELKSRDFVVHDYQYKDPSHVYNVSSEKLYKVFDRQALGSQVFCTGFFASKKGLFNEELKNLCLEGIRKNDAEILYPRSAEQSLLNYMIMKSGIQVYNLILNLPADKRTGDAVTSLHFEDKGHLLYDKGRRLTYLHYIGITSDPFRRLCGGKNIDFPYRDTFLHYRYLNESGRKPRLKGRKIPYNAKPGIFRRVFKRIKRILLRLINARGD